MADAATANYALTKMQPGTHRDDWGDVANTNLDKIDAGIKAAKDQAAAALPKAGGTVTDEIIRDSHGAVPHWDALAHGRMYLAPAAAASPLVNPGDIWFGY